MCIPDYMNITAQDVCAFRADHLELDKQWGRLFSPTLALLSCLLTLVGLRPPELSIAHVSKSIFVVLVHS